jgi:potassium-transporting ATPase ATP-binding subunit
MSFNGSFGKRVMVRRRAAVRRLRVSLRELDEAYDEVHQPWRHAWDAMRRTRNMAKHTNKLFDPPVVKRAALDAVLKLSPRHQVRNPVMFVVFVGSLLTTTLIFVGETGITRGFMVGVTLWLWFTLLFANFAEAMAEGRGKAQADTLRRARKDTPAKKLAGETFGSAYEVVSAASLRRGDVVLVEAGDFIPGDGEAIDGVA